VEAQSVAAAVNGDDGCAGGFVVRRARAGTWARAAGRPDPDVVLVQLARAHRVAAPSICCHEATKSGTVLRVVAMSSTPIPSTASPSTAQAIAKRWSS